MADLAVLGLLVALVAAAGIALGMLAAPELDAWAQGQLADGRSASEEPGPRRTGESARREDGGEARG